MKKLKISDYMKFNDEKFNRCVVFSGDLDVLLQVDGLVVGSQIAVQTRSDRLQAFAQLPQAVAQVLARGGRRVLAPKDGCEAFTAVGMAAIEQQVTEQSMALQVGKPSQRLAIVASLTDAKKPEL